MVVSERPNLRLLSRFVRDLLPSPQRVSQKKPYWRRESYSTSATTSHNLHQVAGLFVDTLTPFDALQSLSHPADTVELVCGIFLTPFVLTPSDLKILSLEPEEEGWYLEALFSAGVKSEELVPRLMRQVEAILEQVKKECE